MFRDKKILVETTVEENFTLIFFQSFQIYLVRKNRAISFLGGGVCLWLLQGMESDIGLGLHFKQKIIGSAFRV